MEFSGAYDRGQIESVLKNPPTIMKKTKKGIERAVPLAPFIHGYTLESAPHALRLTVRLSASPQAYLNPEHLAGLFEAEAIQITRSRGLFLRRNPLFISLQFLQGLEARSRQGLLPCKSRSSFAAAIPRIVKRLYS